MFAGNTLYCGNRQQHGQSQGFIHPGYREGYGQMFNTEYGQMAYGLPQGYQPHQPVPGQTGEGCGAGGCQEAVGVGALPSTIQYKDMMV
jgi:hypothetical protein